jgi:aspartyl-tRNA synthetase
VSNILIVESKNDKYFIEALISYLHPNLNGLQVEEPMCKIDDYQCLEGLDKDKLIKALVELMAQTQKNSLEKIGILIDQDNETEANRINLVNNAIAGAFNTQIKILATAQFVTVPVDDNLTVELACYFTNVNGKGELETVLKAIKNQESVYADCLEAWRNCLKKNGEELSDKEFDKFWVSNYHRFDCCSKDEKKQAGSKCDPKSSFRKEIDGKKIYNFDSPMLDGLKEFLNLFV